MTHLIEPATLAASLTGGDPAAFHWLGAKRSVWIVGDSSGIESWKESLAAILGVAPPAILTVDLTPAASAPPAV